MNPIKLYLDTANWIDLAEGKISAEQQARFESLVSEGGNYSSYGDPAYWGSL